MNIFIIDNYDSFTYNLYQFIGEILTSERNAGRIEHFNVTVKRNNEVTLQQIQATKPDRIIVSPGPGSPDDDKYFGVCAEAILTLGQQIPVLGVCLGMQGIVHVFGGKVIKAPVPMHGKLSPVAHNESGVFAGQPQHVDVMRYHSLMAQHISLPDCLEVNAIVSDGASTDIHQHLQNDAEIMGVRHKTFPIQGIQFHPESFGTEGGKDMIRNFILGS